MMKKIVPFAFLLILALTSGVLFTKMSKSNSSDGLTISRQQPLDETKSLMAKNVTISLPKPKLKGEISLEETITNRRSRRDFSSQPLTLTQVSQILWAAQGITGDSLKRTAPSAGALYPLEIYIAAKDSGVENLSAGIYHYLPGNHSIEVIKEGNLSQDLAQAALAQSFVSEAPIVLVITAEYERTTGKYGERGVRYAHMEVGHVGQNIYLQTEALGLGTVTVGAFHDEKVSNLLNLPEKYQPLYIMPVGISK